MKFVSIHFLVKTPTSNWSLRNRLFHDLFSAVVASVPASAVESYGSSFPYLHLTIKAKHYNVVVASLHNSDLFSVFVENGELIYSLK